MLQRVGVRSNLTQGWLSKKTKGTQARQTSGIEVRNRDFLSAIQPVLCHKLLSLKLEFAPGRQDEIQKNLDGMAERIQTYRVIVF